MAEFLAVTVTVALAFYGCITLIRQITDHCRNTSVRVVWLCGENAEYRLRLAAKREKEPLIAVNGGISEDISEKIAQLCAELGVEGPILPEQISAKIDEICAIDYLQMP